jgi:GNAT superfamily N-acetyltransferase
VPGVVGEVQNLTAGIASVLWNVGASATPPELPRLLREAGLVDPPPPFEPVVAALVLDREPPVDSCVEVRVVASLKDHIAGLEIMLASSDWPPAAAADERARAAETFAARCERGSVQWLACIGGAPVAWAAAEPTAAGLYLSGAATLPGARGRGCYRALIHARWHAAVDLGLPGLAVQSQYGSSYPILRSLGFVEVAQIHTLHSAARGEGLERDVRDT